MTMTGLDEQIAHCWCPDHMDGYCCSSPLPLQMVPTATQHNKNQAIVLPVAITIWGRGKRDKKNNYFCSQAKYVLLRSCCPEGQLPERKHPEWLLVIDCYGNECLIIPSALAQGAAYTVTAPWPAFWQTVTSSCHITQGLIKRDPKNRQAIIHT